jgi:hypothetical protein
VKKTRAVKKSGTHFEQIPLEVVKKIADQEGSKTETAETGNLIIEPVSGKTEPYTRAERSVRGTAF